MGDKEKKKRDREYAKEWRKKNPDKIKAYLERSKDQRLVVSRAYYKKNKEKLRLLSLKCRRRNGYAYDKTPERKARNLIRSRTNNKYPLKGNNCELCDKPAEHRHHTTEPMQVDKFMFLCKSHHDEIHGRKSVLEVKEV